MSDLLHRYGRIHGGRAPRIVRAARSREFDQRRADAASAGSLESTALASDERNEIGARNEVDAIDLITEPGPISIVAVSGSLHAPSKTTVLVREILDGFAAALRVGDPRLDVRTELIELSQVGHEFSGALHRGELNPAAEQALRRIESATLLIVASPVYRASFTGLFKHVFDFVGQYALVDTPVLLAATGGSDRHALIIEHQFRPLFSFFQAITLPIGVYASDTDFVDYRINSTSLRQRIEQAISRGVPVVRTRVQPISEYVGTW